MKQNFGRDHFALDTTKLYRHTTKLRYITEKKTTILSTVWIEPIPLLQYFIEQQQLLQNGLGGERGGRIPANY